MNMQKKIIFILIIAMGLMFSGTLEAKKEKIVVELVETKDAIDGLKIEWSPVPNYFGFKLINETGQKISIIWDETIFMNEFKESSGVLHQGIKYTDKDNPMPETIVPNSANKTDMVFPRDYIFYGRPKAWTLHGPRARKFSIISGIGKEEWQERPIFFEKITSALMKAAKQEDANFDLENFVKTLQYRIILALKVGDEKKEVTYIFNAKIL